MATVILGVYPNLIFEMISVNSYNQQHFIILIIQLPQFPLPASLLLFSHPIPIYYGISIWLDHLSCYNSERILM